MATTLADWLNDGTIPQNKTSGNWTPSAFNTGKFRQVWSPTNASSHSSWRPASLTFWAILTTNDVNGAALWLEWNPASGGTHRFLVVGTDGTTILGALTITWGAAPNITYVVDQSSATAGASTLTISGALTGNGTSSGWTRQSIFGGANLYLGVWGSGGFTLNASTFGDIDDGNDAATLERSAAVSAACAIASSATPNRMRTTSVSGAVAIAATPTKTAIRSAAVAGVGAATVVAFKDAQRSAAASAAGAIAASATPSRMRSAALAAAATIVCAATVQPGARIAATGSIATTAFRTTARTASVAASCSIACAATGSTPSTQRTASISATGAVTVSATSRTLVRSASLTGTGAIAATSRKTAVRSAGVAGACSIASAASASNFGLGAYDANRVLYGTAAGFVTTTLTTQASGSTFVVVTGGNLGDLATAPTDNKGNTYTLVGSAVEYTRWAGYGIALWRCVNGTGGSSHTFSQQYGQTLGFDECTIAVVEVKGARQFQDAVINQALTGAALTSGTVTTTAAAVLLGYFAGDAPTGSTTTVSFSGGYTLIDDDTFPDHPNGYVPIGIAEAEKASPGTYGYTATETPDQGAIMVNVAIQAAPSLSRSASVAATCSIATAATVTHVFSRTATVAATGTVAAAHRRALFRSAAITGASSIAAAAPVNRQRTASVAATCGIAATQARTLIRSASAAASCSITVSADREGPGAQHFDRSASIEATGAIAVSAPSRTLVRAAAVAGVVGVATAATAQHVFTRSASIVAMCSIAAVRTIEAFRAVSLASVGTITAISSGNLSVLPRRFTVTVGVSTAGDFTVEADQ